MNTCSMENGYYYKRSYRQSYYRPEWTCGKYNKSRRSAILYNLIEGTSHFFEEESADVIGLILTYGRSSIIDLPEISHKIGVDEACLHEFVDSLVNIGILSTHLWNKSEIMAYRHHVASTRKKLNFNPNSFDNNYETAEDEYAKTIDGWGSVVFELTYRCNEQCIHCYNEGASHCKEESNTRGNRKELSFSDYRKVIDEFCEQGMFKACITGGDPFMHPHVWDILEYLYEKEVSVELYTNGQALIGCCERLAFLYPRIVGISIYSAIAQIHDKVTRSPGSYERSITVMENLSELGIPLQIKCCVLNLNYDSYKTIYALADQFNALPQIETNIRNTVSGNQFASKNLRLSDEQYFELFSDKNIPQSIDDCSLGNIAERDYTCNACKAGINSCTLTPEGNIIPCPAFHMVLGNVIEMHLKEMFTGDKLNWWRSVKLTDYEECGSHDYCGFCAICPGENYADTANPLKASENKCFMAKHRYACAVKLFKKG